MSVEIFGVRHHGPGCARALRMALEALNPDVVVVEGPPDAESILPLLARESMNPPVALLLYQSDAPERAAFYPFAHFSPEWQALRYAFERGIPARFMDLPQAIQLARKEEEEPNDAVDEAPAAADSGRPHHSTGSPTSAQPASATAAAAPTARDDPLAMLAEAAGYKDHEGWWEEQIEQRHDATGLFEGILEAMSALRDDLTPRDEVEAQREAHMRQTIRSVEKQGFARIAVVCGAWHAPALLNLSSERDDAQKLSGLPHVKVAATWIPWTHSRFSYRSGYGAGINSPGWYAHLWEWREGVATRWVTRAAHLLREQGLDASSASVIEAVRLGEALAAIRGIPMPGIAELREAIQTVLCHGEAAQLELIRDKLEIGEAMGSVPAETPIVPLQRDLEEKQRRFKIPATSEVKAYDLDLRANTDRSRSCLLHQVRLLGIAWGTPQQVRGKSGTFHELWQVQWHPEFAVKLIEANVWGNTVSLAASGFAISRAEKSQYLPELTALLDVLMLAELPDAVERTLERVAAVAAVAAEVRHLMDALPPLARAARYGDVRGTRAERVLPVISALFERVLIGLPGACAGLNDDAAAAMVKSIDAVHASINLLDSEVWRTAWLAMLHGLALRDRVHGLVRGRCCRLLVEQHLLDSSELGHLAGLALSPAAAPDAAAAWVEGVVRGSGLLLLHQDALWTALDSWLRALAPESFIALLPLVRRAFSGFSNPERRAMGEKVKSLHDSTSGTGAPHRVLTGSGDGSLGSVDAERAAQVLPVLAQIMGVHYDAVE